MVSPGWKEVYEGDYRDEDEDEEQDIRDQSLPVRKQGEKLKTETLRLKEGKTKPPARFTEATLLAAMENPVKYLSTGDRQAAKHWEKPEGLAQLQPEQILSKSFLKAL